MRIALLTHEPFYPPSGGGSAEAVYLVRELVCRGHTVHVFGPPVADPAQVRREFGIELHPFTRWRMGRTTAFRSVKYLLYPAFLQRLVEAAARTTRFDLILSQHAISAVAAGRLKRRLGVPVVMNFLDFLTGFMETWPGWLMPSPALAVLKRYELSLPRRFDADAVLTVSDVLADLFVETGFPRDRLRPIYYGYDADRFAFDPAAMAARTESPPRIVMHGSFDLHHLGRIALGAVARVHAERPDAVFDFIGPETGAWRRFAREARKRGLAMVVRHTGFVPYRDVAARLQTGSVGIVPYEESTGVHCAFVAKAVEYLGLGLPVVATPLRGLQRYFRDEPLIRFTGFDGSAFGEAILGWLREPPGTSEAWGRAAAARVRRELDWPVIARKVADLVEEVRCRRQAGRS
jgi:glycosyltransferase involved in cell wall biosynthesis